MTPTFGGTQVELRRGMRAQDYRASRARAYRRAAIGETVTTCPGCGCELDMGAPVHDRWCVTIRATALGELKKGVVV